MKNLSLPEWATWGGIVLASGLSAMVYLFSVFNTIALAEKESIRIDQLLDKQDARMDRIGNKLNSIDSKIDDLLKYQRDHR